MPTNDARHERDGDLPHSATTTGQRRFRPLRWASRLSCSYRRTIEASEPEVLASKVALSVRRRVLREYRAATPAQARRASEELVRAGFNTSAVPYGYRAHRVRIAPAGRRARWRTRLVIEPVEAATVKMIFTWRGEDRLSIAQIRSRLTAARYPAPLDPATGQPRAWTAAMVRAILRNPKYLGRQVWGRRHHGRPVPEGRWVWSAPWAHTPIVDEATFAAAQHPRQGTHDLTSAGTNPEQAP
ncbi:MAG TPA: recombinase family protein [Pseudonocardiaceae bacterium]|nr:recombinase family protein [Pseudonocardiaceae bacterium]